MPSSLNGNLILAVIAAALGSGFQHGYHTGVINVPQEVIFNWVNTTYHHRSGQFMTPSIGSLIWGTTTSIMNAGGTVGGLLTVLFVDNLGPKLGLLYNNIFVVVATVLMGLAKTLTSLESMITGRFLIGVNCGLNAGLCPLYLSEISPVSSRGGISSVYQLVITVSILIAQIVGLEIILGNDNLWPYLFFLPLGFALFQVISLLFCAESPKFLISKKNNEPKAKENLQWLRGGEDVGEEMATIKAENDAIKALPAVSWKDMFNKPYLRKPLAIALLMMIAQQFSGINAVIFYSSDTFAKAGLSKVNAQYATIGIGTVNVITTIVSLFLVEIAGRRTLLLLAFGGMAIDTALLTICLYFAGKNPTMPWIAIVFVFVYIILFAIGAGAIPWFLVNELFDQSARSKAVSLAVPTNWIANFIVTLSFPSIQGAIGPFVFLIFVALNVVFFLLIIRFVPETKNKTIEEITSQFK